MYQPNHALFLLFDLYIEEEEEEEDLQSIQNYESVSWVNTNVQVVFRLDFRYGQLPCTLRRFLVYDINSRHGMDKVPAQLGGNGMHVV